MVAGCNYTAGFDSKRSVACTNLEEVIDFYTRDFRRLTEQYNLYASFLQEEEIIRPLQEYYENLNRELLDKWFEYTSEYQPGSKAI